MNFPGLPPASVGNDELDRRPFLHCQFASQCDGIGRGIKQKSPVLRAQEIFEIERSPSLASYPHFAVHQSPDRQLARIAAPVQFSPVNDQTNPGA